VHRCLTSVFAFDRMREGGVSRGFFSGPTHPLHTVPYARWHGACGLYGADFAAESSARPLLHRAALGMPHAPALINRVGRSVRCDLDFGGDDDGQVERHSGFANGSASVHSSHRKSSPTANPCFQT
jgi:hypothetical protein